MFRYIKKRVRSFKLYSWTERKRKGKSLKKHAESFFTSRLKKFSYYYKRTRKSKITLEANMFKNQLSPNFKFGIQGKKKQYVTIAPMIALIKVLKVFRRLTKFKKQLKFRVCSYPDFWLTMKPKSVRMGKGKSDLSHTIDFFYKGAFFFEWRLMKKIVHGLINEKLKKDFMFWLVRGMGKQLKIRVPGQNMLKINTW